jgi:hypothetical protein
MVATTFGAVGSVEVDGCKLGELFAGVGTLRAGVGGCTLGTAVLFTLVTGVFSLLSLILAASLKMSVSCRSACVCFGLRSIGAFDSFCIATMRSCAASLKVSPGSIAGSLQCAGKNFAEPDMR